MFLLNVHKSYWSFVLDEHAIEMSSKSGLGYLTAAYRTQVRLFVSVSVLAPFALYILYYLFFTLFSLHLVYSFVY